MTGASSERGRPRGSDQPDQLNPGDQAPPGTRSTGENLCRQCGGSGRLADGTICPTCNGTGRVVEGVSGG